MRAWPKAFEFDPVLRAIFVSACEAQAIYGVTREQWKPKLNIDIPTINFVWNEAKRLLNNSNI